MEANKKVPKVEGLGDVVEVVTTTLGVKKIMPKNCGCDKRRKKLNKLVPFKSDNIKLQLKD